MVWFSNRVLGASLQLLRKDKVAVSSCASMFVWIRGESGECHLPTTEMNVSFLLLERCYFPTWRQIMEFYLWSFLTQGNNVTSNTSSVSPVLYIAPSSWKFIVLIFILDIKGKHRLQTKCLFRQPPLGGVISGPHRWCLEPNLGSAGAHSLGYTYGATCFLY